MRWSFALLLFCALPCLGQETRAADFDAAALPAGWQLSGGAALDTAHAVAGGALKVPPGAQAIWRLRTADGAGRVSFKVYEDGTTRADEKQRGAGPLYGLLAADGRVLVAGTVFAPYLAGNTTYALSEYDPGAKEQPYFGVTYLGHRRTVGWHAWVFDFDATKGLRISHNGQDLSGRWSWAKSRVKGFVGVVLLGDTGQDKPQTLWVDDVAVTLGAEGTVDPMSQLCPATDPAVVGPAPAIVPALAKAHPRLLFGADDVAAMRALTQTPQGKILYDRLLSYLGACQPPTNPTFLTDATDGQRQGMWRMPSVALHYLLTGDKASLDKAVGYLKLLLSLDHWETGELDCGMSSANIMIGAALCYDWLYDALEPAFREQVRAKLWLMARRQYYLGHLMRFGADNQHYWQGDPQNNHRWHRDAGMSLALLAAWTGEPSQQWMMTKLAEEMRYVADWLPSDGTSHESPGYMIFGGAHLSLGMQAMDRCLGTDYLQRPFFANLPDFMMQTLTPGMDQTLHYGDQGGTATEEFNYDVFELLAIGRHQRGDLLALADDRLARHGVGAQIAWLGLVWYPRGLAAKPGAAPTEGFFADLGVQFVRDQWAAGGRAAMFRCGPLGGYLLNRYRAGRNMAYVNVAHDDPDANSFILFGGGEYLAETDRYSSRKRSANHNTILVNGVGQTVPGRDEGGVWSQPGGDMSQMAVVVGRAASGRNLGVEGEAGAAYSPNPRGVKRPALDRYRRAFLWVEGRYVLVLDDIRAPSAVDIDWLLQSGQVNVGTDSRYELVKGQARCALQVAATQPLSASVVDSPADNKGKPLGWKQLRLHANTTALRLASVYDLWGRGPLTVTLAADAPGHAVVKVSGAGGLADTWDWTAGAGRLDPSTIVGSDAAGAVLLKLAEAEPATKALLSAK